MPALMSHNQNPYSYQQPSPDSQSFANMNLASPQRNQGIIIHQTLAIEYLISDEQQPLPDQEIEDVSGKLESFSLSDAIETSLNMQGVHGMQAPSQEPRRGVLILQLFYKVV